MKTVNYLFIGAMSILLVGCNQNTDKRKASTDAIHNAASADSNASDQSGAAQITFEKTVHDFGKITQGEKTEYSFKFTNTGSSQLIISDAAASCGCTVPEYSKEPINPGETGFIKVIFDSDKRVDRFEKSVTIRSNTTPNETVLYITGMVIPKPEDQYKMLHE